MATSPERPTTPGAGDRSTGGMASSDVPYGAQRGYEIPPAYGAQPPDPAYGSQPGYGMDTGFAVQPEQSVVVAPSGGASSPPTSARDLSQTAKQTANQVKDRAVERADQAFSQQKHAWAGQVEGLAQSLHRAAGSMEQDQQAAPLARYAHNAADSLSRLSSNLRDRDLRDLVDDVQQMARRQPGLFIGGALALGFGLVRFLKSSARKTDRRVTEGGV
jgi:hypothetical protein